MSGGGVGQGAVYSPLPQSISDTDSSEEELNNIIHHNDNRKFIVNTKDFVDKHNGKKMGEYRPLGYDGEGEVSINGLPNRDPTTADDVPIIKPDGPIPRHLEPMSPLRKVFFILSILLCGLTIVVFLWLLPCDWATCPSAPLKSGTKSWEATLHGVELKGGISVVAGVPGRGRNLVFLARGDVINAALGTSDGDQGLIPASEGGLISLVGSTGKVAWFIRFFRLPLDMDCSIIDVTGDKAEDCIVLGTGKMLAAVNPVSGNILWYLHSHQIVNKSAVELDFPIVLPDLDGDGVRDLVTACSFNDTSTLPPTVSSRNNLIIISGKMGSIIGQGVNITSCLHVQNITVDENWNIAYVCQKSNKTEAAGIISVQDLYTNATNKQMNFTTYVKHPPLKQHQTSGISTVKKVNGHRLILENKGKCPTHCYVYVRVLDERQGDEVVWHFKLDNTYGMTPAVLVFNNRSGNSDTGALVEPVSGFVLKLWIWTTVNGHTSSTMKENDTVNSTSNNALFRSRLKRSPNYRMWDEALFGKMSRFRRGVFPSLKQTIRDVHQFKERIVLYTFNSTDNHVDNASLSDIIQICSHQDQICQPDLAYQEQSLLIADLDEDGSQELISYLTTYTTNNPEGSAGSDSSKYKLQSRVRVIQLEAEFPKLYEAVARQ